MNCIRQYLVTSNTTQAALAAQIGVSASMMSLLVAGKRCPSPALVRRIESVTGIPRHELRPDIYEATQ